MIPRLFFIACAAALAWFIYKLLRLGGSNSITPEEISDFRRKLATQSVDDIFGELETS